MFRRLESDFSPLEISSIQVKIIALWLFGETLMENHESFLREAIALSKSAVKNGDEPFGSVLVKGGEVILRAENSVFTGHDMTNHAEMNLVKAAAKQHDPAFLADCTLYTSTEPCAMCAGAIYWSGIGRMVFACSETRLGEIAGIGLDVPSRAVLETGARKVTVVGPTELQEEAAEVHKEFWPKHLGKA
jgi:tRNA(Arg) A34 adenosine deaminase TadA